MWIALGIAIAVVGSIDLYARYKAPVCDGCKGKFLDSMAPLVFWQKRVFRPASPAWPRFCRDGERMICSACVESRRAMEQIDRLRQRGDAFRAALRDADAKVKGTIRAEAAKIARASKDLEV